MTDLYLKLRTNNRAVMHAIMDRYIDSTTNVRCTFSKNDRNGEYALEIIIRPPEKHCLLQGEQRTLAA
jgi:hypothetical protein